jgi:hypothetical protein
MSDNDIPIEKIADLVGHRSTVVTQTVYRHHLRARHRDRRDSHEHDLEPPEEHRIRLKSGSVSGSVLAPGARHIFENGGPYWI